MDQFVEYETPLCCMRRLTRKDISDEFKFILKFMKLNQKEEIIRTTVNKARIISKRVNNIVKIDPTINEYVVEVINCENNQNDQIDEQKTAKIESKPLELQSDTKVYLVRDSFTNYKEGSEAVVDLSVEDFIRASSSMFPDQTRDPMIYCEFICDILEPQHPNKAILIDLLGKCASEYCLNKIEGDSPKMWSLFDDLLYYMILRKFLDCEDVKIIMKSFPSKHNSDIENGMKWFLSDKHYFAKAVDLPNFPSSEVRQALMMPEIIHHEFQQSML